MNCTDIHDRQSDVLKIKVEYRFLDQVLRYEHITCV